MIECVRLENLILEYVGSINANGRGYGVVFYGFETIKQKIMSKSINRFLIEKGIKSNTQKISIIQMVKWVDEWQEEVKNCSIPDVSEPVKEAYQEGFNDGTSAAADAIAANPERL